MTTHLAAVCPAKGEPFEIHSRPTPTPGPGELLIEVKSVALNPADYIMRAQGLLVSTYPTVLGFDMVGIVIEVGDNVPGIRPGTRVAAYAAWAWKASNPDYGAFQEKCLVPWQHAILLPDDTISWNEAATLPVSIQVPLSAWDSLGIAKLGPVSPEPAVKPKKNALLIWGASSSVGTMGVQTARLICEDPSSPFAAVYATAGVPNHEYVQSLGARRVFDYKEAHVVDDILSAAREDGLVIQHSFLAMGELAQCQQVLGAFVTESQTARIASAPPIPLNAETVNGVETIFVVPSNEEEQRLAQFQYWMGPWVTDALASGAIQPSPKPEIVGRGLEAVNAGLDKLDQGVSCTKLVIELTSSPI
ncbi:GroES-like protein [Aspergillus unguis]